MEASKMESLLAESIEAANRTTHAVRAFVRFLFIQLSFYTAAFLSWQVGLLFTDESNCTIYGCTPHVFWYFLVALLIVLGVVFSSRAGWKELELSDVPHALLKTDGNDPQATQKDIPKIMGNKAKEWFNN
jgi:hypothetical protein